jgi:CPA2 family monovalent cation:H+ antiporter-2
VLAVLTLILSLALWRNASNLQGHARAGAQIIASALAHQMASTDEAYEPDTRTLEMAITMVPGLGEPVAIRVAPESLAAGRSLSQLNLRGATGATVLAIRRGNEQIPNPLGREIIHAGDLLAVAGAREALAVARGVLAPNIPRGNDGTDTAEIEAEIQAVNDVLRMRRV